MFMLGWLWCFSEMLGDLDDHPLDLQMHGGCKLFATPLR